MTNAEVAAELKKLEDKTGRLTAEKVVEAAKVKQSPLHSRFEWDDGRAAHAHRIDTARALIRVVYMPVRTEKQIIRVPVYTRDPSMPSGEQGYRAVMKVRDEADEAHAALSMELSRLNSIIERVRGLAIVLGLEEAVDALDAQISAFAEEIHRRSADEEGYDDRSPRL